MNAALPAAAAATAAQQPFATTPTRLAIARLCRAPEPQCLPPLLAGATQTDAQRAATQDMALRLVQGLRSQRAGMGRAGLVQSLLQEFALSSQEGVALMCLAEALLRIPDQATRDALIRDKIGKGNWQAHLGHSESIFVNAASWGLLLTGKLLATHSGQGLEASLRRVLGRGGEPVIRKGLDMAMRLMGEQFVTGQTIHEALDHARQREAQGFRYSYDMLGEAALTEADAHRYLRAYEQAIEAIGAASSGRGVVGGPGISIKLSALHPRYHRWQAARVHAELYPRLLGLVQRARAHDIGLNIDAEESERLDISLDLLERLCAEPSLQGWSGLGFVVQAYQKRAPAVVEHVVALARAHRRRLMVRLVKGAYWDSEIKRAQAEGQAGFPVYTRKAYTDVAYLACAAQLLEAPDAVYPQFATHNAHTVAAVMERALALRGPWHEGQYEFQCLHGMGEPLYEQLVGAAVGERRPCRIYAPVGTHETLLAYLVRRLLENGANTSFVNRVANEDIDLEALVEDPVLTVQRLAGQDGVLGAPHPGIAHPLQLLGTQRRPAVGVDLQDEVFIETWEQERARRAHAPGGRLEAWPRPADASVHELEAALAMAESESLSPGPAHAASGTPADGRAPGLVPGSSWPGRSPSDRAAVLEAAADLFESRGADWLHLLADEAGKTVSNGVAEVREAVDFLRYYAQQLRACANLGPVQALGPVLCISPWNFPLAIFTGQVAAALAAGNTVLAKPAEQTPRIAWQAVQALWEAGVPRQALHLLSGPGETVGAHLVADRRVQAVLFTGSTEVARLIQRTLADRLSRQGQPIALVAETGGQNAMIVDSSALLEQVTGDVLASAFDSAGQRCSALRVLCVQEEAAPALLAMIRGAMDELQVGCAGDLSTDVGPVIDAPAQGVILAHIERLRGLGCPVHQTPLRESALASGTWVAPTLIEIPDLHVLEREVFGPVLHVLRYRREQLPDVLEQVRQTGYGLTMGVHSRIDETVAQVVSASGAGNLYVNRNMVGAVVGVQPFGGEGLSGTGPKAGGPLALLRLMTEAPPFAARQLVQASGVALSGALGRVPAASAVDPTSASVSRPLRTAAPVEQESAREAAQALLAWLHTQGSARMSLVQGGQQALDAAFTHDWRGLAGPTGETNAYAALPREAVLCLAGGEAELLRQTCAALAVGSRCIWPATFQALHERLPASTAAWVALAQDWRAPQVGFDAVLAEGSDAEVLQVLQALAQRPGALVSATRTMVDRWIPLERLVVERSVSVNTAAAGGNASLMTMG